MRSFTPRYYEIQQQLRARIAQLEPDEPLPSDAMLCEEFHVSRMTARNAVRQLVQEGLVYRVPGRGTFVAGGPAHRQTGKVMSFTDQMRRSGREPRSRLVECVVRSATESEVRRLGLRPDAHVVAVRRVRLADGEPIALEVARFPEGCAPRASRCTPRSSQMVTSPFPAAARSRPKRQAPRTRPCSMFGRASRSWSSAA